MKSIVLKRIHKDCILSTQSLFESILSISGYNWLVTDVYPLPIEGVSTSQTEGNYTFLSAEEILAVSGRNPWIFAVFSGFKPTVSAEQILSYPLPLADGNPDVRF